MGAGEESSPPMSSKLAASTQETPTTSSYPDWSASMQAYYGAGATPPPYFTSPVPSPAPHPYMWGSQHLVTPYGSPLPYPALYPHGGIYAHPNMTLAQGAALTNTETEGKASNGKELMSFDKAKGTSKNTGLAGGKSVERGKATSGSGNDGASQCSESFSESSSEATDENSDQRASSASKKRSFNQLHADGNLKTNNAAQYDGENPPASASGKTSMPATNLNMGMDLWNASPAGPARTETRTNASGTSPLAAPAIVVGHEGMSHNHQWIQDERELKREKRKQSNRESARRSRLRKQAECEELQTKVQKLGNDNRTLRDELNRLAEECEKLTSENNSIMEELTHSYGRDVASNLEGSYHQNEALQSLNGEQSSQGHDTSVDNNSNSMTGGQNGRLFNSNASNANHDS